MEPAPAPPPRVPGYELGLLLGRGGCGEVWEAVRERDGVRVAVKVSDVSPEAVEGAAREASVTARVAADHVLVVESCLPLADGRTALVLPLMRGGSLAGLVAARGHLSSGEVVTVLAPVAAALGRLHAAGVVHGDVSPGNVLLGLDGRPVLADLGLGRVLGEAPLPVWGTEGHLAPEVLLGAEPGPAADVYALGALGWLCLSGSVPGAPGLRPALSEVSRAGAGAAALVEILEAAVSSRPDERPSADELAGRIFDAATAAPLRLADTSGGAVESVTYRLRAAAADDVDEPSDGARSRGLARVITQARQRGSSRRHRDTLRLRDTQRHRGTRRLGDTRRRPTARRRVASGVVALTLTAGVAGWAAAALDPDDASARTSTPARAPVSRTPAAGAPSRTVDASAPRPPPVPAASSAVGAAADVVVDVRMDPSAPRLRPVELLTTLAAARARAWERAATGELPDAEVRGGPLHASDAVGVAELARAGLRYEGLGYRISDVVVGPSGGDVARLTARVGTTAYRVVGGEVSLARAPAAGELVAIELVRTADGWRLRELGPP